MTNVPTVGHKYCWRGLTATVRAIEDSIAIVQLEGSTVLQAALIEELTELPSASDLLKPAMQIREADWERASELAEALRSVLDLPSRKMEATQDIAERFGLSTRRVYSLIKAYRVNPTTWSCIRAKPGRKLGSRALDVRRELILHECIEKHYLRAEKPSIVSVHEHIQMRCEVAGLSVPSRNTLRARIEQLDLAKRVTRREGGKRASEVCDPAAGHVDVQRPLQRIEIDHTLVDVQLRADTKDRELMGRPWLTLAIDYYSRMILGFYVSWRRPSSESVALCLAHGLLQKDEWLKWIGVTGDWPVYGYPEEIWVDNALEFRAVALRRGCNQYQIKLCYRPPGEPQVGGTIERLIGTQMGRVHLLPGTTQSNTVDRGDYDPEANAQLTLREFLEWFTLEVVTRYHTTTHSGLGKPPVVAWREAWGDKKPMEPGAPMEVLASFLPAEQRVLRRTGIELHRSQYWTDAFGPWIGHGKKIVVHNHPWDPERIYARVPNGELVVATACRRAQLGKRTVDDHLLQISADRKLQDLPVLKQSRFDGLARKEEIIAKAIIDTRNAKKSKRRDTESQRPVEIVTPLLRPHTGNALTVRIYD